MLQKQRFLMETGTESNLKILEAQLFMNHITVNPSIFLAHHHVLQTKYALYPFSKVKVKSLTIYPGNKTHYVYAKGFMIS